MNYFRDKVKKAILVSKLPYIFSHIKKQCCIILSYHSINNYVDKQFNAFGPSISHNVKVFEKQVRYVIKNCAVLTMDNVTDILKGKYIRRGVIFTFDDGFHDNYKFAGPILQQSDCHATFYISTGCIEKQIDLFFVRARYAFYNTKRKKWEDSITGLVWDLTNKTDRENAFVTFVRHCSILNSDEQEKLLKMMENSLEMEYKSSYGCTMMNWDQVKDLSQSGHLIGSHTCSHVNLAQIPFKTAVAEIEGSKNIIFGKTSISIRHFSYPNPILTPNWNEQIVEYLKDSKYATAVTSRPGCIKMGDNPYCLKRIHAPHTIDEFIWRLEAAFAAGVYS